MGLGEAVVTADVLTLADGRPYVHVFAECVRDVALEPDVARMLVLENANTVIGRAQPRRPLDPGRARDPRRHHDGGRRGAVHRLDRGLDGDLVRASAARAARTGNTGAGRAGDAGRAAPRFGRPRPHHHRPGAALPDRPVRRVPARPELGLPRRVRQRPRVRGRAAGARRLDRRPRLVAGAVGRRPVRRAGAAPAGAGVGQPVRRVPLPAEPPRGVVRARRAGRRPRPGRAGDGDRDRRVDGRRARRRAGRRASAGAATPTCRSPSRPPRARSARRTSPRCPGPARRRSRTRRRPATAAR